MRSAYNFPMLLPLIALSAGIYLGEWLVLPFSYGLFVSILLVITLLYYITAFVLNKFFLQWLPTIFMCLAIALTGYFFTSLTVKTFQNLPNKFEAATVKINSYPESDDKFIKYKARVLLSQFGQNIAYQNSKMTLFVNKDTLQTHYNPGDILTLTATLRKPTAPLNPGQINFRKIYRNKGIYYQCFAKQNDITKIGVRSSIQSRLLNIKHNLIRILNASIKNASACSIVKAMLLGNTVGISDQIYASFATAGIVHILSVSGLHVGIILLLLERLLFFLNRKKSLKGIKLVIIIGVLVFYAAITGFAAPVNRCVLMFSLISVGRYLNNTVNIYNIIFAAAFILLLVNPLNLFDAGFQLSFLAVTGIVWFFPILNKYTRSKYKFVNYLFDIINVSLAAQVATLPLVLYHFGQFPLYFILSNLVAAPLSVFFLIMGVATLFLHWMPIAVTAINFLLNMFFEFFISSIFWFTNLPFAGLGNLFLPEWIGWIVFAFIISIGAVFTVYQYRQKKQFLLAAFLSFMVFSFWYAFRQYQINKTNYFVILADYGNNVMGFKHGKNFVFLEAGKSIDMSEFERYFAKTGITKVAKLKVPQNCIVTVGEYKLLSINKNFYPLADVNYKYVDYILLHEVKSLPQSFLNNVKTNTKWILTGSMPFYYKDKIKRQLVQSKMSFLDVMQTGSKRYYLAH